MPDELLADRTAGNRYRLDEADGTWWEVGWDSTLGTFHAEHRSPVPFDPFTPDDPLAAHGFTAAELPSVDALAARLPIAIPDDVATDLERDAAAHAHAGDLPRLHLADAARQDALPPGTANEALGSPTAATTLPAQPLADTLVRLRQDPYLGADDMVSFARGLGLDPATATGVLDGSIRDLSVEQIAEVCEALRCSPYDLWGAARARTILDVYGPERWPRYIEPLDEGRQIAGSDEFLRRRIEQQANAAVTVVDDTSNRPFVLQVTRFRQTGVIAVDRTGRVTQVEDSLQPADPASEYHFTFRQLGRSADVVAPFGPEAFERGCPPGHDAPPALVSLADSLEHTKPGGADMLRFVDTASGSEQWLGRETPFDPWQSWDDPRIHYPGNPADVLACMSDGDVPMLPLDVDGSDRVELPAESTPVETVSLDF